MELTKVVAVHGILNTYGSAAQMRAAWSPALVGGAINADRQAILRADEIGFAFYGDLFRPPGRFLSEDIPYLTAEDVTDDLEINLLFSWWAEAAKLDASVVPPEARALGLRS